MVGRHHGTTGTPCTGAGVQLALFYTLVQAVHLVRVQALVFTSYSVQFLLEDHHRLSCLHRVVCSRKYTHHLPQPPPPQFVSVDGARRLQRLFLHEDHHTIYTCIYAYGAPARGPSHQAASRHFPAEQPCARAARC